VYLRLFSVVLVSRIKACLSAVACHMLNNGPDSDLAASLQDANPPDSTARQCNAVHEIVVTAGHNPAEPSISDGRTDGQAGRQTDRQTDRQTETC